jgi:HK97 family phage major capsid protein
LAGAGQPVSIGAERHAEHRAGVADERFVADELIYGLRRAVEAQVVAGSGSGANMTGILSTSGIVVQAFATNALTTVRKAITTLEANGYTPGVIALHATDWETIELLTVTSGAPMCAVCRSIRSPAGCGACPWS